MDSPSSPILTSEGSPVIILEETGGWWMLVQGSSCTVPEAAPKVIPVLKTSFPISGFFLSLGL
jgi:hypothetical protein